VSNGSFFYAFASKEELAAELYIRTLSSYHDRVIASLGRAPGAEQGIELMIRAHLSWVVQERSQARFLFEQAQSHWVDLLRERQHEANERLREAISSWALPLMEAGTLYSLPLEVFGAQLIGPTQMTCRAWLAGRGEGDPGDNADRLIALAQRALVSPDRPGS